MAGKAKTHTDDPSRAGELKLVGRAVALDFANTSSGRGGPQHLEHLREPEHVVAWAEHEGVIDGKGPRGSANAFTRAIRPSIG